MKLTNKYPELIYDVMDVTDMRYPDKSFDMVLDKSVIDALLCSDAPYSNAAKMLHHIHRVLSDDGYYFAILYGRPEQRMIYLKQKHVNFDITVTELKGKTGQPSHYIYACKKLPM